eukprot:COSAG02_NODE_30236_length_555_cov_0.671053_1_plen_140_part_00
MRRGSPREFCSKRHLRAPRKCGGRKFRAIPIYGSIHAVKRIELVDNAVLNHAFSIELERHFTESICIEVVCICVRIARVFGSLEMLRIARDVNTRQLELVRNVPPPLGRNMHATAVDGVSLSKSEIVPRAFWLVCGARK